MGQPIKLVSKSGKKVHVVYGRAEAKAMVDTGDWKYDTSPDQPERPETEPAVELFYSEDVVDDLEAKNIRAKAQGDKAASEAAEAEEGKAGGKGK
jgi:hypothetical protein